MTQETDTSGNLLAGTPDEEGLVLLTGAKRVWTIDRKLPSEVAAELSETLGQPTTTADEDDSERKWSESSWYGLYKQDFRLEASSGKFIARSEPTPWAILLAFGITVCLLGINYSKQLSHVLPWVTVSFKPEVGSILLLAMIISFLPVGILFRGPHLRFRPYDNNLIPVKADVSIFYIVFNSIILVSVAIFGLAGKIGPLLFIVPPIFGLLFVLHHYTEGTLPFTNPQTTNDTTNRLTGAPIHLRLALIVLLPPLLIFLAFTSGSFIGTMHPDHPNRTLAILLVRAGVGLLGGLSWAIACDAVLQQLRRQKIPEYDSRLFRLGLFIGYGLLMALFLIFISAFIELVFSSLFNYRFIIAFEGTDLAILFGMISLLMVVAGLAAFLDRFLRLHRTSQTRWQPPLRTVVSFAGHLSLATAAIIGIWMLGSTLPMLIFDADPRIYEPTLNVIRSNTEQRLMITAAVSFLPAVFIPVLRWSVWSSMAAPFLLLLGAWIHANYQRLRSYSTLTSSTTINRSFPGVPDDIEVRVVDTSACILNPVTRLFGAQKQIVVSRPYVDQLDSDAEPFAAILAHEAYHLQNRDMMANTVATLGALFLSGRNSLLAFYDYSRAERKADMYAAEQVSPSALARGLREAAKVKADCEASFDLGALANPGVIPIQRDGETDPSAIRARLHRWLSAPYNLLFSNILFDRAHRDIDTRVKAILEFND